MMNDEWVEVVGVVRGLYPVEGVYPIFIHVSSFIPGGALWP